MPTSLALHLSDDEKPVSPSTSNKTVPIKSCMRSRVPEILISVKSASVDPAGFVRAITCRGGDGRKRPLHRAGARPTSISNDEPKCTAVSESNDQTHRPPISPKSDKPRLRFTDGNYDIQSSHRPKSSSSSCSSSTSSLHSHPEDAIRFELSISYAGRKYSATRTLNRLVRLRQDLMREIEDRRPGIVVPKRSDNNYRRQSFTDDDTDVTASISFESDQSPRKTPCTSNQNTPPPVVVIPELPVAGSETPSDNGSASRPHKDHRGLPTPSTTIEGGIGAAGSLVSGSFTRLHMALAQYCPAVENWFHRILTDILPDPESSPSLIAFLWEPLGLERMMPSPERKVQPAPHLVRESILRKEWAIRGIARRGVFVLLAASMNRIVTRRTKMMNEKRTMKNNTGTVNYEQCANSLDMSEYYVT